MDQVGGVDGSGVSVKGKRVERGREGTEVESIRISEVAEMRIRIWWCFV